MKTVPHVIDLIKAYQKVNEEHLTTRTIFVLEMIEKVITYPPTESITSKDVQIIDNYTQQLEKDLRKDKQYLLSVRISKIWKKRDHLIELARNWHEIEKDYIDEIEYHQEIKWLRDERRKLIQSIRKDSIEND